MRHDGKSKLVHHPVLEKWLAEGRVVRACPELLGGLGVPRPPAERVGDRVVTNGGADVTAQFEAGARAALSIVEQHGVRIAVLKEFSPSCGSAQINDGTFSKSRIVGAGVTTTLLRAHGVQVFSELQWNEAAAALGE